MERKTGSHWGVAIVGCGTVGGATAELLVRDAARFTEVTGISIELKAIVDLDFAHARALRLPEELLTDDLDQILSRSDIDQIIELVGGTTIAREITRKALSGGKHVCTANKALLAHHGNELFSLARANGVTISFEASCGGGIPVVRALYEGLLANRMDALYGVVNGTCNYILTAMVRRGQSYAEALERAQSNGLAEADPTLDVSGHDSAHKLAILASLAFGCSVDLDQIPVEGIDTLESIDVAFGQELGYVVKLLAVAQRREDGLSLRVRPSFIGLDHPLAWVSGPFNAVSVYGDTVGHTMYYGRGAGGSPTASAIVADILAVAIGAYQTSFRALTIWSDLTEGARQLATSEIESRYYLRLMVEDKQGVFARIASILGDHGISISSVLQKEPSEESVQRVVPVVITTHNANEGNVRRALEEVDALPECTRPSVCINIIDEHEETI